MKIVLVWELCIGMFRQGITRGNLSCDWWKPSVQRPSATRRRGYFFPCQYFILAWMALHASQLSMRSSMFYDPVYLFCCASNNKTEELIKLQT